MLWIYCWRSRWSSTPAGIRNGTVPPSGPVPVTCARAGAAAPPSAGAAAPRKSARRLSASASLIAILPSDRAVLEQVDMVAVMLRHLDHARAAQRREEAFVDQHIVAGDDGRIERHQIHMDGRLFPIRHHLADIVARLGELDAEMQGAWRIGAG